MRYLSLCSGIEAATVAWHPLGWTPVGFAEIEPFPAHVLHHHYDCGRPQCMPDPNEPGITDEKRGDRATAIKAVEGLPLRSRGVVNLGDMTNFKEWPDEKIDLLVAGTPCQSFSVSGLRAGLADPRGNLALTFLAIAERRRPQWIVWENVRGVLSSLSHHAANPRPPAPPLDMEREGQKMETEEEYDAEELHDFNCFLAGLSELGYGWATRVLDSQYIRVDGYPGGLPQRRPRVFVVAYRGNWRPAAAALFERESFTGNSKPRRRSQENAAHTAQSGPFNRRRSDGMAGHGVAAKSDTHVIGGARLGDRPGSASARFLGVMPAVSPALKARDYKGVSSDAHGDGAPLIVDAYAGDGGPWWEDPKIAKAVAEVAATYNAPERRMLTAVLHAFEHWGVRYLTPVEFERLQGFPDDYTQVPFQGKSPAQHHRYKALGNSMAINTMRWIGQRIEMINQLKTEIEELAN